MIKNRIHVFIYSVYAGLAIALGGLLYLISVAYIPDNYLAKLVGSLLFPVGLLLVLFFRFNLYTGKIGIAFRNKSINKEGISTVEWLINILLGNLVGAFILGFIIYGLCQIGPESKFAIAVINAGNSRNIAWTAKEIIDMSYKSILCGALVYLAVLFFNKGNNLLIKVSGVVVPIAFFVFAGFQHCVANMFYLAASLTFTHNYLVGLVIAIIGNSIGAILLDLFVKYDK